MTTFLTQTIPDTTDDLPGDCWRTAIACLLDFPNPLYAPHFLLDSLREYGTDLFAWQKTVSFVRHYKPGRTILVLFTPTFPVYASPEEAPEHVIATGPSPRGDWMHSVIVDAKTGELVWDPHPSRAGLNGPPIHLAVLTEVDE